jgi:hypothetical protein
MRTMDIEARLHAKRASGGSVALCPAHHDRSPSLSIRAGRDGRTILHCFAGCEPSAIVQALGLEMRDLFADAPPRLGQPGRQQVTADDVERELQAELGRIIAADSERCGFDVVELTRHRNEARAIIERRFDVALKREQIPWWQVEPHAVDPAWETCVQQAIRVTAARDGHGFAAFERTIAGLPRTQHRVLLFARRYQRELAQPATARGAAA